MDGAEVTAFLTSLATRERVSASTQNQALSALLFLYRDVLGTDGAAGQGHRDVGTTMIYLHVLNRGALGVRSPVDRL